MKVPLVAYVCFALLAGCGGESPHRIVAENRELDERFREALLAKDVDRVMACWWENPATVHYPGDKIEGIRGGVAIRDAMQRILEDTEMVIAVEFKDQQYMVHGDAVIGTGVMVTRLQPVGLPKEVELVFRYTDIREKKNDRWVYTYRHESTMPFM
jgi:ketosteroid isomerase-like protein